MSRTLDKFLANGVPGIAFAIGRVHVMHVFDLLVLPTRGIRVFHLMIMPSLLFLTRPSIGCLQKSLTDRYTRLALVDDA